MSGDRMTGNTATGNTATGNTATGNEMTRLPGEAPRTAEPQPLLEIQPLPQRQPLLEIRGLTKTFPLGQGLLARWRGQPRRAVQALTDVNLSVRRGETLGIVGESGCGKSTLARTLVRLYTADSGEISYAGLDVRWEDVGTGELFPHVYGPIHPADVLDIIPAHFEDNGGFVLER